jgi:hypothetical protein
MMADILAGTIQPGQVVDHIVAQGDVHAGPATGHTALRVLIRP